MLARFRSLLPALALLFVVCTCARAQETCNIRLDIAPDYGGVKLGMSLEELKRMFPGSDELRAAKADAEPLKVSLGMLDLNIRKEDFEGVKELTLDLSGGRVTRIGLHFGAGAKWRSVSEFSEHVSKQLALPRSWAEPVSAGGKQSQLMECRGFMVFVQVVRGSSSFLGLAKTDSGAKGAGF